MFLSARSILPAEGDTFNCLVAPTTTPADFDETNIVRVWTIKTGQSGTYNQSLTLDDHREIVDIVGGVATGPTSAEFASGIVPHITATTIEFTGLQSSTVYYFRMRCEELSGGTVIRLGPWSNELVVQVGEGADVEPPSIGTVTIIPSDTTASFSWGVTEACINSIHIVELDEDFEATSGVSPQGVVTGLNPGTKYNYILTCTDAAGNSNTTSGSFNALASDTPGLLKWANSYGPSGIVLPKCVAADSNGNIYVGCTWSAKGVPWNLGNGQTINVTPGAGHIGVLLKLDSTGVIQWGRPLIDTGAANPDGYFIVSPNNIAIDSEDNVIVTGNFSRTVDFGGTSKTAFTTGDPNSIGAPPDAFLAKYNSGSFGVSGALVWVKQLGGIYEDIAYGLCVDSSDNILVGGKFLSPTMDCGNSISITNGTTFYKAFLAKVNSGGTTLWAKALGVGGNNVITGACVDTSDDVFVSGEYSGTTNLGGSNLAPYGGNDCFRGKFASANGAHVHSERMGSSKFDKANCIAKHPSGAPWTHVIGGASIATDLNTWDIDYGQSPPLTAASPGSCVVVAAYNGTGSSPIVLRLLPNQLGPNQNTALGIAVGDAGVVALTGVSQSGMYLGYVDGRHVYVTSQGFYILALTYTGDYIWHDALITSSANLGAAICFSGDTIIAVGQFLDRQSFRNGTTITAPSGTSALFIAKWVA